MYNLKTYLRNVYELEASVYQQERCIHNIQSKLSSLPTNCPAKPRKNILGFIMVIGSLLLGGYLGLDVISYNGGWDSMSVIVAIVLGFLAISLLGYGITGIFDVSSESKADSQIYQTSLQCYTNGQTVKNALEADLPALRNKLSETQSLLRSYYAKGILHPKYQNFVAVAYLLDCIDTGRHTKLDGPDGAYNQFELEVRMDRISSQLDTVIDKLDQIRQNQYSLYAAITQANRTNQMMFQKLDSYCRNLDTLNANANQIRQSLNTANHTAELTRKEIAYRNYLDRGSSYSY